MPSLVAVLLHRRRAAAPHTTAPPQPHAGRDPSGAPCPTAQLPNCPPGSAKAMPADRACADPPMSTAPFSEEPSKAPSAARREAASSSHPEPAGAHACAAPEHVHRAETRALGCCLQGPPLPARPPQWTTTSELCSSWAGLDSLHPVSLSPLFGGQLSRVYQAGHPPAQLTWHRHVACRSGAGVHGICTAGVGPNGWGQMLQK